MNAIWLDDDVSLRHAARTHEEVMEEYLQIMHSRFDWKVMGSPRPEHYITIDHDPWRARIEKE